MEPCVGGGVAICMDSILVSGSLGRLCKAIQRQSGETGGGRWSAVCALHSHSLLDPERVQEKTRLMEVGAGGGVRCGGVAGKVEGCTL